MSRMNNDGRIAVLRDTWEMCRNPDTLQRKKSLAQKNHGTWSEEAQHRPGGLIVQLCNSDWGDATLAASRQTGQVYAVLNMANDITAGGGYKRGISTQEENIARRTNLPIVFYSENPPQLMYEGGGLQETSLTERQFKTRFSGEDIETIKKGGGFQHQHLPSFDNPSCPKAVRYDDGEYLVSQVKFSSSYNAETSELISATKGRVYIGEEPLVCIKKSEADGYALLQDTDIFSFYEIRSAAVCWKRLGKLAGKSDTEITEEMEKRIEAQFQSCKERGIRYLVLGAFGCGDFGNNPEVVAAIYVQKLIEHREHFDHVVFPVFDTPYQELEKCNYPHFERIFKEKLHDSHLLHLHIGSGPLPIVADVAVNQAESSDHPTEITPPIVDSDIMAALATEPSAHDNQNTTEGGIQLTTEFFDLIVGLKEALDEYKKLKPISGVFGLFSKTKEKGVAVDALTVALKELALNHDYMVDRQHHNMLQYGRLGHLIEGAIAQYNDTYSKKVTFNQILSGELSKKQSATTLSA